MRINPKYVGIGLVVVFVLFAVVFTIRAHRNHSSDHAADSRPSATPSTAQSTAGSSHEVSVRSNTSLRRNVKQFVSLYFSFNPDNCNNTTWKDQLRLYATDEFLSGVNLGDCSSGPRAAMLREGATSKAMLSGNPVLSNQTDDYVEVTATIRTTKFTASGEPEGSVPFTQTMVWQYIGRTWRITTFD